ncbi:MAG: hypothetical protein JWM19_6354 [Actinomycetia bacterium]|nr:hypothetical protein [Actinomycetes bacterium]
MPTPTPATLTAFYATTAVPTLCVSLESLQGSIKHGQSAEWMVSAWSVNGDIPYADLQLTATKGLTPEFSFGCGSYDGTGSCDLGSVYSGSTARQVIAKVTVPASAKTITSVRLTVTESAANLTKDPSATVAVPVKSGTGTSPSPSTSPSTSTSTTNPTVPGSSTGTGGGSSTVSPLPVGSLPTIGGNGATSSLSPGGNAAGLFPTVNASQVPSPGQVPSLGQGETARPVADTEALPIGTPVIDAQLLGLGALAVAFLLAVTRMSVRRRPAAAMAGRRGAANAASTARASTAWTRAEPAKAEAALDDSTADDFALDDATTDDFALDNPNPDAADVADPEPWEMDDEA